MVSTDTYSFTSDGNILPRDGSAGDLMFTGEAGTAADGDPGNRLYQVGGGDITRVEMHYQNSGSTLPSDSHFALGDLCFTPTTD